MATDRQTISLAPYTGVCRFFLSVKFATHNGIPTPYGGILLTRRGHRIRALLLWRQNDYFGDAFGVLWQPLRPGAAAAAIDGRNRRAKLCTVFYCGSSTAALLLRLFYCGSSTAAPQ